MSTEQQAQLLEEIAAVMRERPEDWWREFEFYAYKDGAHETGEWLHCWNKYQPVNSLVDDRLRRRPRTITIAGIEVPEPMWEAPLAGAQYFVPHLTTPALSAQYHWDDDAVAQRNFSRGLCHHTPEAAKQHARALILASGGEV